MDNPSYKAGLLFSAGCFDVVQHEQIDGLQGPVTGRVIGGGEVERFTGFLAARMAAYYGYRMAKAALNMAGVNLAHDLRGKASVAILHPGLVATRMTGFSGVSTEESASGLIERIDALDQEGSGGFWHANGDRLPW